METYWQRIYNWKHIGREFTTGNLLVENLQLETLVENLRKLIGREFTNGNILVENLLMETYWQRIYYYWKLIGREFTIGNILVENLQLETLLVENL